jgi:hypothetical protein
MDVALKALGDFAGDKWTDFNIHDPGVTIIEYLAYAIHDLSFRTNLPTADLVASVLDEEGIRHFLPSPSHCLEAPIVTDNDIRALILDLHFVRNVWVEARDDGLKDIVIDVSAGLGAQQRRWLRQAVREVIVRHRMISVDVGSICFLKREPIEVELVLEIPQAMTELDLYLTRLLSEIDTYIMMLPRREPGQSFGAAQFGPKLAHGDFTAQSLLSSVRRDRLDLSALIELIENTDFIEGEKNRTHVRQLRASRLATREDFGEGVPDSYKIKSDFSGLSLDPNCAYELDLDTVKLTLQKDGVQISPDLSPITATVRQIRNARALDKKMRDIQVPDFGETRADLANYRSTQTEFPELYALKKGQLTKAASRAQRAQAKQLQGFILLLEQFIANAMVRVQESAALIGLTDIKSLSPGMVEGIEFHAGMEESHTTLKERAGALLDQDPQTSKMTNKWTQSAASLFGQTDDFGDIYSINQTILERFRGWNYQICPEGDRSLLWLETHLHKYLRSPEREASRTGDTDKVKIDILPYEHNGRNQYQFQLSLTGNDSVLIGQDIYQSAEVAEKAGADALSIAASRHRHHVSRDLRRGHDQKYIYELLGTRGDVLARSSQTYNHTAALERYTSVGQSRKAYALQAASFRHRTYIIAASQ